MGRRALTAAPSMDPGGGPPVAGPPPRAPSLFFLEGEAGGERKTVRCVWGGNVALGGAEYAPAPPSSGSSLKSNLETHWHSVFDHH